MRTAALAAFPLALFTLAGLLAAQKLPLARHGDRQLQLFDLQPLLPPPSSAAERLDATLGLAMPADRPQDDLQALAAFARNFVVPPLGNGDDLQPLAGRWLALVGSAEQAACLERLLVLAQRRRDDLIDIEVRFLRMSRTEFDANLRQQLTAVTKAATTTYEQVFAPAAAEPVLRALAKGKAEELTAPRVTVRPWGRSNVMSVDQTAYVKDLVVSTQDGATITKPIVDIVWDGVVTDLIACYEPDGTIALSCDVQWQEVQKPLLQVKTSLPSGQEATVQLPRVTGASLHQVAHVRDGDLVVQATERIDGSFLVAMVAARSVPKAAPPKPR